MDQMSIKKIYNCEIRDCELTHYLCNENDEKIVTGGDFLGQKAFNMCVICRAKSEFI